MRSRAFIVIAAVVWMMLLFAASSLPAGSTGPDTRIWSFVLKGLHFLNYGILSILLLAMVKGDTLLIDVSPGLFALCLLLTTGYALSDEYHQFFSPGRHPAPWHPQLRWGWKALPRDPVRTSSRE
jgi:VanZ family protein